MTTRHLGLTTLGLLCIVGGIAACGAPSVASAPTSAPAVQTPQALAKVAASSTTERLTNVASWRIYHGTTTMAVMGFDANNKPVDTLRVRYGSRNDAYAVSYEGVISGAVLQIAADGSVVQNTFETLAFVHAGQRALEAWAAAAAPASGTDSTVNTASLHFRDDPTAAPAASGSPATPFNTCVDSVTTAVKSCGTVVAECAGAGVLGTKLGIWGTVAGVLYCLYQNVDGVAQCAKDGKSSYDTCYSKPAASTENTPVSSADPASDAPQVASNATNGTDVLASNTGGTGSGTNPTAADPNAANGPTFSADDLASEQTPTDTSTAAVQTASNDTVDPNAGDPDATDDPNAASNTNDDSATASLGGGGLHFASLGSGSRSHSCATGYALQCGLRSGAVYCRCKQY